MLKLNNMKRGIVYLMWGNKKNPKVLEKSINSVKKFGYEYKVIWDESEYKMFQKRIGLFDRSPFETTLYLDADTVIKDNIDFGFEMAEKYGVACAIAPASSAYDVLKSISCPLAEEVPKDLIQYNCGVIFFNKKAKPTFDMWGDLMKKYDGSIINDQPYFSYSIYKTLNPYVLSKNWNYRPHLRFSGELHGKLKILHKHE